MKSLVYMLAICGLTIGGFNAFADQTPEGCTASTFIATLTCQDPANSQTVTLKFNGSQVTGTMSGESDVLSGAVYNCTNRADVASQQAGMLALAVITPTGSSNGMFDLIPLKSPGMYVLSLGPLDEIPSYTKMSRATICTQK